ncbi:MAG: GNAT family N-acetyltransferase [Actinobacteria bacterium]|nr:GNAT family N-acetyltransferase [Actinomycetota bacterium]
MAAQYEIRKFNARRDIEGAYKAFADGFRRNSWPLIDQAEPAMLKDAILDWAELSDVSLVAEADGKACAILLGSFPREGSRISRIFGSLRLEAGQISRVLAGRYEMTPLARSAFRHQLIGDLIYVYHTPKSPAEILLLSSQNEYRGGIGRALMDAWVAEVRRRGYSETVVGTDSTLSYGFYEKYGFKRIREFSLKTYRDALPGEKVKGYIYRLDIGRE